MTVIKYLLISTVLLLTLAITLMTNLSGIPEPEDLPEFVPADHSATRPSNQPDRIFLTMTKQPDRSAMLHWRSNTRVKTSKVQVVAVNEPQAQPREWLATSQLMSHARHQAVHHHALVEDLMPDTQYRYRVGDSNHWSQWFTFTTASDQPAPFTFTFFGDVQTGLLDVWPAILKQAQDSAPQSHFNLFVGDLIDQSEDDEQWQAFFAANPATFSQQPLAVTPGNHEYDGAQQEPAWAAHFRFPDNGPEGSETLDNSSYYFDYQGVRFISVNTNIIRGLTLKDTLVQRHWLEELLTDNPNRWTIVFQHLPVKTSIKGEEDSLELKLLYAPLYEEYGVDMILQGDDHTYARGQTTDHNNQLTAPVYITANSGSKAQSAEAEWATVTAEKTPMFQVISVDGDTLKYEARTASGEPFDVFELSRQDSGVFISDLAIKQPQG